MNAVSQWHPKQGADGPTRFNRLRWSSHIVFDPSWNDPMGCKLQPSYDGVNNVFPPPLFYIQVTLLLRHHCSNDCLKRHILERERQRRICFASCWTALTTPNTISTSAAHFELTEDRTPAGTTHIFYWFIASHRETFVFVCMFVFTATQLNQRLWNNSCYI